MASSAVGMLRSGSAHLMVTSSILKQNQQQGAKLMVVECSSRPQKKATAHHMKTRPKKTQPWDVKRRGPTVYPPLPPLPPDWTLVSSSEGKEQLVSQEEAAAAAAAAVSPAP